MQRACTRRFGGAFEQWCENRVARTDLREIAMAHDRCVGIHISTAAAPGIECLPLEWLADAPLAAARCRLDGIPELAHPAATRYRTAGGAHERVGLERSCRFGFTSRSYVVGVSAAGADVTILPIESAHARPCSFAR